MSFIVEKHTEVTTCLSVYKHNALWFAFIIISYELGYVLQGFCVEKNIGYLHSL